MAASEVDICNQALSHLGERRIISFTDGQKGELCEELYPVARDYVLRKAAWGCALEQAVLTRGDYSGTGYLYQFTMPPDSLKIVEVVPDNTVKRRVRGRRIVSNAESMEVLYVKRVTDTSVFDVMLEQTIAARLAYLLASPITKSAQMQAQMLALFNATYLDALGENQIEGFEAREDEVDWSEVGR